MNGYKILKCFRKEKRISGELPCPATGLISSFFFLSNFQMFKFFITFFSGTVRPRRLKLGTHMDRGQMYRVYWLLLLILSFLFLSFQFSNIKIFLPLFSGTLKLVLTYPQHSSGDIGPMVLWFIFLSLQFSNIKIFRHEFPMKCEA